MVEWCYNKNNNFGGNTLVEDIRVLALPGWKYLLKSSVTFMASSLNTKRPGLRCQDHALEGQAKNKQTNQKKTRIGDQKGKIIE